MIAGLSRQQRRDTVMRTGGGSRLLQPLPAFGAVLLSISMATGLFAQAPPGGGTGMPDPRQMSGIPLPVGDVPAGTVTVRLVRGSLSNPITGHAVELQGGATPLQGKTNEAGRAQFTNVRPGTRLQAVAVVGNERLVSQEFEIPPSGGIRLMLVAAGPHPAGGSSEVRGPAEDRSSAQPGTVVLGDQSRFIFELNDDGMSVFTILQILNAARVPVEVAQPLMFDLPDAAEGVALLEGSSPQAAVAGRQVTVTGPFAPGMTLVQFGYSMPYSGDVLTVAQRLPAALTRLTVLAQKVGETHLTSPQMAEHRDMTADGQTYIVGQGPALNAGDVVTFNFTGLPHAPTWPRNLAIGLAVVIFAAGAWGSVRRGTAAAAVLRRRRRLEDRRDRFFKELTSLEEQHRAGELDAPRYAVKRREIVSALERIYAELDEEAAA